jgi:hypothetical protein
MPSREESLMEDDQSHVNKLQEIKLAALRIQETLKSTNADAVRRAMREGMRK